MNRRIAVSATLASLFLLAAPSSFAADPSAEAPPPGARLGLHAHASAVPEVPLLLRAPSHVDVHGRGSRPFVMPGSRLGDALLLLARVPGEGECLWRTDGTAAGTFQLGDCITFKGSRFVAPVGDRLVFPALFAGGLELWATDGSVAGTRTLTDFGNLTSLWLDIAPTPGFERLVFPAFDEVNGFEPWLTDGTPGGTGPFADARPGPDSSWPSGFSFLEDGRLLFFVNDLTGPPYDVFSSDLTAAGTGLAFELDVPEFAYVSRFTAAPEAAIFWVTEIVGPDVYCEGELRRTDGTAAGTYTLAKFVLPGCVGPGTVPVRRGGHLYFELDDGVHGSEIWRSDGTALERVTDAPGSGPLVARRLRLVEIGSALLVALDGGQGRELWRLEGDEPVAAPLVNLCPGECSGLPNLDGELIRAGEGFVFHGDDGESGEELWFTDGTAEGTRLLADVCPGACSSSPGAVHVYGDYLLVGADDGTHGTELWRIALPSGFATRLTDLPAVGGVGPWSGQALGSCLVFQADDGTHGAEPWVSNGSRLGTRMIEDLALDEDVSPRLRLSLPGRERSCKGTRFKRPWWCPCVAAPSP